MDTIELPLELRESIEKADKKNETAIRVVSAAQSQREHGPRS
jgi:hypothetical protein